MYDIFYTKLDACNIMGAVASKTGASKKDMDLFSNYYEDTLYNDKALYGEKIGVSILSEADIQQYADAMISKYITLYNKLQDMRKEFPSSVTEYSTRQLNTHSVSYNPNCGTIGFESGTLSGWSAYYSNNNSTAVTMTTGALVGGPCGAVTEAAQDPVTNKYKKNTTWQVKIMSAKNGNDLIDQAIPCVCPKGGKYSCRLGDSSDGGSRVGMIRQSFVVTPGNTALTYMYSVMLDQAPHYFGQQPHFLITIIDSTTGDTLPCGKYIVISDSVPITGFTAINYLIPAYNWTDVIYCKPWTYVFVPLQNYMGHTITVEALVSDCFPTAIGPHFCYAYFDAACSTDTITSAAAGGCGGGNDSLFAPLGGLYKWSGPGIVSNDTLQNIEVNSSGTYSVTITNEDGCSYTLQTNVTIKGSGGINVTATTVNASCSAPGSATATATGGNSPYTYSWSNGNTNQTNTGLSAGNYTCTVISGPCTGSVSVTITGGSGLTVSAKATPTSCSGNTGTASATFSGGSGPYTFSWNPGGQSTATASGLGGGVYTITVTDKNGCTGTASATVANASGEALTISGIANISCFGGTNGSANAIVTGGTTPYTYSWSPSGGNSASANGLAAGTYTITVTDNKGCAIVQSVPITQPAALSSISINDSICGGNSTNLNPSVSGGTSPYTYSWSPGAGLNCTACPIPIASPTSNQCYSLNLTDNNGCMLTTSACVTVTTVSAGLTIQSSDSVCNDAGTITLFGAPIGGVYSGVGVNGNHFYPDSATLKIFDKFYYTITRNGCQGSGVDSVYVENCTGVGIQQLSVNSGQLSVYPNPNNGSFQLTSRVLGNESGSINVEIYNVLGQEVYSKLSIFHSSFSIDLSSKASGMYFCRVIKETGELVGEVKFVIE